MYIPKDLPPCHTMSPQCSTEKKPSFHTTAEEYASKVINQPTNPTAPQLKNKEIVQCVERQNALSAKCTEQMDQKPFKQKI